MTKKNIRQLKKQIQQTQTKKNISTNTSITIKSHAYKLKPLPPGLMKRAPGAANQRINEIVFTSHKEKSDFIKCVIGGFAVKTLSKQTKFYKCDYLDAKIKILRRHYFFDMEKYLGDILDKLQEHGINYYYHGGIIRDILIDVKSADIDIIFDKGVNSIIPLCQSEGWPCSDVRVKEQYINFGIYKGDGLEGTNVKNSFTTDLASHEASVNDLAYDPKYGVLIDITGFGLEDIINRKFRLGAHPDQWMAWVKDPKRPFRYFKLIQKGFMPINDKLHTFIKDYIKDNWDTIYNRPISDKYPITWIKQIIIATMTQGTFDLETGSYTFGPTKYKLYPYLQVLKRHLGKDIYRKILETFTRADIKELHEQQLITEISSVLQEKEKKAKVL
jgi:hypothetical protein